MRVETTIGIEDPAEPDGEALECAIVGEAERERCDGGSWGWSAYVVEASVNGCAHRLSKAEEWRAVEAVIAQAEADWHDAREAAVGL